MYLCMLCISTQLVSTDPHQWLHRMQRHSKKQGPPNSFRLNIPHHCLHLFVGCNGRIFMGNNEFNDCNVCWSFLMSFNSAACFSNAHVCCEWEYRYRDDAQSHRTLVGETCCCFNLVNLMYHAPRPFFWNDNICTWLHVRTVVPKVYTHIHVYTVNLKLWQSSYSWW